MKDLSALTGGRPGFLQSSAAPGLLQAVRGLAPAYADGVPGPGAQIRVGGERVVDMGLNMGSMACRAWTAPSTVT